MSGDTPNAWRLNMNVLVEGLQKDVRDLREKLREHSESPVHAIETLTKDVGELRMTLARIEAKYDEAPAPFYGPDLPEDERAKRDEQLRAWVRDVLAPAYLLQVPPCWEQHPDVRVHMNGAWLAWLGAHRHPDRKIADPDKWNRDSLPKLVEALTSKVGRQGCKEHGPRAVG